METNEINRAKYPKNTLKTLKQNTNGVYFIRSLLKKNRPFPKSLPFFNSYQSRKQIRGGNVYLNRIGS